VSGAAVADDAGWSEAGLLQALTASTVQQASVIILSVCCMGWRWTKGGVRSTIATSLRDRASIQRGLTRQAHNPIVGLWASLIST
jgi:hypothetical protein